VVTFVTQYSFPAAYHMPLCISWNLSVLLQFTELNTVLMCWQCCYLMTLIDLTAVSCVVCCVLCVRHSDLVQQGLVSSSKPSPAILANDVVGPLLLEVSTVLMLLFTAIIITYTSTLHVYTFSMLPSPNMNVYIYRCKHFVIIVVIIIINCNVFLRMWMRLMWAASHVAKWKSCCRS